MKKTPLRKVSKKQSKRLTEYAKVKADYMKDHLVCEMCGDRSRQLHHKRGRGRYLCDPFFFAALCAWCHNKIHENPNWARATGWLIR